jgi:hypothetical protein
MLAEDFTGKQNFFPVYSWKIFHPQPDRYLRRFFVYIHEMDGRKLDAPTDYYDLKDQFPHTNQYTINEKINDLGYAGSEEEKARLAGFIDDSLGRDHPIVWELVEIKYEVISFYLNGTFVEKKTLSRHVVNGAKT